MNRETWKHIRAETDDDHEWLPNPRQTGVLGLCVTDAMIDGWLAMMSELAALLDGKRTFTFALLGEKPVKNGKGLNLKTLLDDRPEKFVVHELFQKTLPDKYFAERKDVNIGVLFGVLEMFENPLPYAIWFN